MVGVLKAWCSVSSVFDGKWIYDSPEAIPAGVEGIEQFCPKYHSQKHGNYVAPYLCGPYGQGKLQRDCEIMPLELTFPNTSDQLPSITFVGDSLANQLRVEAECLAEYFERQLSVKYVYSVFLRNDYPCWPQCIPNGTFFQAEKLSGLKRGFHRCIGCPDGVHDPIVTLERKFAWVSQVPASTKILVVNGGAWYTTRTMHEDSNAVYRDTLSSVASVLKSFVDQGVDVYWYPITPSMALDGKSQHEWERTHYETKNNFAKSVFRDTGVTYLNITSTAISRKTIEKARNLTITKDGLHWCGPGPYAFTRTILESIFHLHTVKKLQTR